jgi:hypothetical protein
MNNYQKFGLIAGQVFMGLGFGLIGTIVGALLAILYSEIVGVYLDLFPEIMSAAIGGYIGMQTGIGFVGYKFLKSCGRQAEIFRVLGQSFLGLILGLVIFYIVTGQSSPNWLTNLLAIALPLIGVVIGFNFRITAKEKENG